LRYANSHRGDFFDPSDSQVSALINVNRAATALADIYDIVISKGSTFCRAICTGLVYPRCIRISSLIVAKQIAFTILGYLSLVIITLSIATPPSYCATLISRQQVFVAILCYINATTQPTALLNSKLNPVILLKVFKTHLILTTLVDSDHITVTSGSTYQLPRRYRLFAI